MALIAKNGTRPETRFQTGEGEQGREVKRLEKVKILPIMRDTYP